MRAFYRRKELGVSATASGRGHASDYFAFWILLLAPARGAAQTANDGAVSLTDLVREVKVTLQQVADAAERENLPNLDNAVLEAKTSMKIAGDGKIGLWVVEIGDGRNSEYASTVTLTLKPAPPGPAPTLQPYVSPIL